MPTEAKQSNFEGSFVQNFLVFREQSRQFDAITQCIHNILPEEFKSIGAGKSSLDVLGVGSGGGEVDVQILTLLQSTVPDVPITADIVEGSSQLTDNFKALVAMTTNLQKIPFAWHIMPSENYERQVKAKGDMKRFDFIHMIQMLYFVDNLSDTIKFYHSLLKSNGRLMIIIAAENNSWDVLWKTYTKELCVSSIKEWRTSREVIASLKSQGLIYEEHAITGTLDISECFNPNSQTGEHLLSFFTMTHDFNQSFTPEVRAGILDLLSNKCSTDKDGRVLFNIDASCILVHT
ncbi:histamine N-methyltransferase-like [Plectropomus leopardus]|uniref:histamine N-methyltransferase-like n=1 Tax=Plectropomus leopardus TaxID=160734 RepID=UPI001C4C02CC|nr:histamine N-methyltransferase-like [Plectropomus leopardus]